jgi:GH24 family phage-related lysozyme (muramidase)
MKISDRGLEIIKKFEGYHKARPDGGCEAYQERINGKLDIPTIGWGCTEGVYMGLVWTKEQAEEGLRRELAKHEAAVTRLVTVELNQNQFDALCSFCYNLGEGNLSKSTLLRKLNAGDYDGAAAEFARWDKFKGTSVKGLAARRAREAALFLEPAGPVEPSYMPQQPEPAPAAPGKGAAATGAAAVATGVATQAPAVLPEPGALDGWLGVVTKAATAPPVIIGLIIIVCAFLFIPRRKA